VQSDRQAVLDRHNALSIWQPVFILSSQRSYENFFFPMTPANTRAESMPIMPPLPVNFCKPLLQLERHRHHRLDMVRAAVPGPCHRHRHIGILDRLDLLNLILSVRSSNSEETLLVRLIKAPGAIDSHIAVKPTASTNRVVTSESLSTIPTDLQSISGKMFLRSDSERSCSRARFSSAFLIVTNRHRPCSRHRTRCQPR
jgi:hypothetical protein